MTKKYKVSEKADRWARLAKIVRENPKNWRKKIQLTGKGERVV